MVATTVRFVVSFEIGEGSREAFERLSRVMSAEALTWRAEGERRPL